MKIITFIFFLTIYSCKNISIEETKNLCEDTSYKIQNSYAKDKNINNIKLVGGFRQFKLNSTYGQYADCINKGSKYENYSTFEYEKDIAFGDRMYNMHLGFLDDTLVHIKLYPLSTNYSSLIFELIDFFGMPNSTPITKTSSQKTLGFISSVDATIEKSKALKPVDVDDYFIKRNFSSYSISYLPLEIRFNPEDSNRPTIPEKKFYNFYRESFKAEWEDEIIISYFGTRNPPSDAIGQFFWNCNIDYYSNATAKNIIEKLIEERNLLENEKIENQNSKLDKLKEYF